MQTNFNYQYYCRIFHKAKLRTSLLKVKVKICIAPRREKLTSEALVYGSHSFYTANTPYLPSLVTHIHYAVITQCQ